jgi:hypothetical protein
MMRKKIILTSIFVLFITAVIYLGFIKKGFVYFTGISTPYSYFQAKVAVKNKHLIMYEQDLISCFGYYNGDSLMNCYGFSLEYGGYGVSYSVIKLYNSVILDELIRRLGEKKWNEYQFKADSLSNIAMKEFDGSIKKDTSIRVNKLKK